MYNPSSLPFWSFVSSDWKISRQNAVKLEFIVIIIIIIIIIIITIIIIRRGFCLSFSSSV